MQTVGSGRGISQRPGLPAIVAGGPVAQFCEKQLACEESLQKVIFCQTRNLKFIAPVCCHVMREQIRFLQDAAKKLRQLAVNAPDVADQLLELANELETEARRLQRGSGPQRH